MISQFTHKDFAVTVYQNGRMEWQANFVWPTPIGGSNVEQYTFGPAVSSAGQAVDHAIALIDAGRIH